MLEEDEHRPELGGFAVVAEPGSDARMRSLAWSHAFASTVQMSLMMTMGGGGSNTSRGCVHSLRRPARRVSGLDSAPLIRTEATAEALRKIQLARLCLSTQLAAWEEWCWDTMMQTIDGRRECLPVQAHIHSSCNHRIYSGYGT
jgi:hypothetical protein